MYVDLFGIRIFFLYSKSQNTLDGQFPRSKAAKPFVFRRFATTRQTVTFAKVCELKGHGFRREAVTNLRVNASMASKCAVFSIISQMHHDALKSFSIDYET